MGPRASTIWYVDIPDPAAVLRDRPAPDADAARALASRLYPETVAVPLQSGTLADSAAPAGRQVFIGSYPGVTVVCEPTLAVNRPSLIDESWTSRLESEHTYLVCAEDTTPWGAFACWERGELRRSFSATSAFIHENIGLPLVWEREFWGGEHPAERPIDVLPDPQTLPFDPGEFADAANLHWLGFRHSTPAAANATGVADVALCGFTLYAAGTEPVAPPAEPEHRGLRGWWRRRAG
ncbi:DUF6928 family protein [Rhodococcus sp. NPDC058505]|uniref:DUF6928 family protein n=1 Tax=Rhodococcus sp. NPDC058505 TaxID=3346531 RepID=UPI00365D464B